MRVEMNVFSSGSIGQIVRNRTVNPATYELEDLFFHYDQVGSVMTVSDNYGQLAARRHADAFGNTLQSWSDGLWATPQAAAGWGHNTKETDGGTGLVYMYQRWYLPHTGTFASQAPYPPMMEHPYGYALNNPLTARDPSGEKPIDSGKSMLRRLCWATCMAMVAALQEDCERDPCDLINTNLSDHPEAHPALHFSKAVNLACKTLEKGVRKALNAYIIGAVTSAIASRACNSICNRENILTDIADRKAICGAYYDCLNTQLDSNASIEPCESLRLLCDEARNVGRH